MTRWAVQPGAASTRSSASLSRTPASTTWLSADEYFRGTTAVEPNYQAPAGPIMTGLVADHRRLLGNGHCTRPAALDCIHESICENCGFFETGPDFVPVLIRQRDHAADYDQHERAQLITNLLDNLDTTP